MARSKKSSRQLLLPGLTELRAGGSTIRLAGRRIPHSKILTALDGSAEETGGLVNVYRSRVLPVKTRTIHLLGRKSSPRITETLLGYEVLAGYKRVHCPDRVTARYVMIFTEIGCHRIRLPYDPTVTEELLPSLERSLTRLKDGIAALFPGNRNAQMYVLQRIFSRLRSLLNEPAKPGSDPEIPISEDTRTI
jgi:hypothetical protein